MMIKARALLQGLTPLRQDCGRLCGAACCQADEDGQGGMLLFPGEEALYTPCPDWAQITDLVFEGLPMKLLTCKGACPREERPLACRIFPLTPVLTQGRVEVALDRRAFALCPLTDYGPSGLRQDFACACRQAMTLLARDPACYAYFEALERAFKALAQGF